jgi:uncharacterized protein (TIGR00730 family)
MNRICVFCGSSDGARPIYKDAARRLGVALARRRVGLVYGGGRVGLMGAVADALMAEGGEVVGVIPHALVAREAAHEGLTELRVVDSMHERKALMATLADAFVSLPGGMGTIEETCEMLTWAQLGIHRKPCAVVNVDGYFDPLLAFFDRGVAEGFIRPEHRALLVEARDPEAALDLVEAYRPPALEKWITRDET